MKWELEMGARYYGRLKWAMKRKDRGSSGMRRSHAVNDQRWLNDDDHDDDVVFRRNARIKRRRMFGGEILSFPFPPMRWKTRGEAAIRVNAFTTLRWTNCLNFSIWPKLTNKTTWKSVRSQKMIVLWNITKWCHVIDTHIFCYLMNVAIQVTWNLA